MGKHAYLILCHDQWELLQILLKLLDDTRNDIFIHIDKKSKFDPAVVDVCKISKVILTERVKVQWGGYSVVRATMILLKTATENGHYDYYHLLSGHDLPLKSQDEIHKFFDEYQGKEFISLKPCDQMDRVKYYYPTQEWFSSKSFIGKVIRNVIIPLQKIVGIDRTKKSMFKEWGIGSQFFDITDSFARYLCDNVGFIHKVFHSCFLIDEIAIQTVFLNSEFNTSGTKYVNSKKHGHQYIEDIYMDVKRAIDWKRGTPYIFQAKDYNMLLDSECLFARKFDIDKDYNIVEMISKTIKM